MEAIFSLIFHSFVAAVDIYSLVWLRMVGGFKWTSVFYFTIWSLMLQIMTVTVFSLRELSCLLKKSDGKDSKKDSAKNVVADDNWSLYRFTLFHLSFVSTLCAGMMFWSIYAIDPNALNPQDFYYPLLLNNMHHTFPWIFSLIQVFFFVKREINSFSLKIDAVNANEIGMVSTFLMGVLYSLTALSKKFILGKFPYPFMNDLTRIQYSIFNMFLLAFGMMISNISTQVIFKISKAVRKQVAIDKSK